MFAEAGEGGVGVGEFEEAGFGVADGEAEAVVRGRLGEGGEAAGLEELLQRRGAAEQRERFHGGDVERVGEGAAEAHGAEAVLAVVGGAEEAGGRGEIGGDVGDDGGGVRAVFEGEEVGEGFEGRAGGARCPRAVDLAGGGREKIFGADEGEDFAGAVVEDDGGGVAHGFFAQRREVGAEGGFGDALEFEVERGAEGRGGGAREEFAVALAEEIDEVRGLKRAARRGEARGFGERGLEARGVEVAEVVHAAENPVLAAEGAGAVAVRVEARGGLREAREERGFGGAEVGEGFGKEMFGGGGDAEAEVAVVEAVQVFGEDAVFGPELFEAQGLGGFANLGGEGARARFGDFDELLGDGGAAGENAAVPDEAPRGAQGGEGIDAGVLPEAFVFGGKGGVDEGFGDLFEAGWVREAAVVVGDFAEGATVAVGEFEAGRRGLAQRGGERDEMEGEREGDTAGEEDERDQRKAAQGAGGQDILETEAHERGYFRAGKFEPPRRDGRRGGDSR